MATVSGAKKRAQEAAKKAANAAAPALQSVAAASIEAARAAAASEPTATYAALSNIRQDGENYRRGEMIELTADDAAPLLRLKAIAEVGE